MADAIIFATAVTGRGPPHLRRAFRQTAARRLHRQGIAMNGRPFFVPMIGIVLLFAALGPAVGGVAVHSPFHRFQNADRSRGDRAYGFDQHFFWPRPRADRSLHCRRRAGRGDRVSLCAVGRRRAPARAARAHRRSHWRPLVYGLLLRLNPVWASLEMTVRTNASPEAADLAFPGRIGVTLGHAFVACAAIAGLVSAFAANLIGLTMRPELTLADRLHPPGEGG